MSVAELAQALEVGTGGLGVFAPGRNGHETDDGDVFEWGSCLQKGGEFFGRDTVLRLLVGELYFDVDGKIFVERSGGSVESVGDLEGVDGVNGVEELCGPRGLIGLQRTDEVVLRTGEVSEGIGLRGELLDAIFAEETMAGGVGLDEELDRMDLGDGHEGDV